MMGGWVKWGPIQTFVEGPEESGNANGSKSEKVRVDIPRLWELPRRMTVARADALLAGSHCLKTCVARLSTRVIQTKER